MMMTTEMLKCGVGGRIGDLGAAQRCRRLPVDMCDINSASPAFSTAATESERK